MGNRYLPLLPLYALLLVMQFAFGCDTHPAPAPAPAPPAVTLQTTAPDDFDPMAAKLAREASAHRAAPSAPLPEPASAPVASVVPTATPAPFTGPLPPPEGRRWQDSGVLVLELLGEEDAKTEAASLRWEFSHGGAGAWTNNVDAVHIYEKLWAVRVSPVDLTDAKRVCAWLWNPKPKGPSWMEANARRVCRFSSKPTLTSKTEYEMLGNPSAGR